MTSIYQTLMDKYSKRIGAARLLKFGLNFSPMYRRSTSKILYFSKDMFLMKGRIRLNWKNKNYMNSMFGGSMFSAIDPLPMLQIIQIIGKEYVVWDKSAEIFFKRPARESIYFEIEFDNSEIEHIKKQVAENKEYTFTKKIQLTNKEKNIVFCEIDKRMYVAEKKYYFMKKKAKNNQL